MAIALNAEYGELCPSCISLSGRNWTKSNPADSSHFESGTRSGISPIPQLRRDGIEKSGTSTPACRPVLNRPGTRLGIGSLQHAPDTLGKDLRLGQQADDEERFVSEVEKNPGCTSTPSRSSKSTTRSSSLRVDGTRRTDDHPASVCTSIAG